VGNIVTDRSYQQMAEDMIEEALFPTQASYDTFPTARYPASTRLKGADDFTWTVWPSGTGMIRWKCLTTEGPSDFLAGAWLVSLNCEVAIAVLGPKSADEITGSPAGHQTVVNDLYKASEVIRKQLFDSTLTQGEFGISSTTVVTGQGTSPYKRVWDVTLGSQTVEQRTGAGEDDNLGPNAWIGVLPVTIQIVVL